MRVLTFDVETTHVIKESGSTTPLPYFGNRLVSIGYQWLGESTQYLCFYHATEKATDDGFNIFQTALDLADVVVGQNLKFDLCWIRDCGFKYDGHIYDTMVAEYVLSKGAGWPLNLEALAKKYSTIEKKKDLTKDYLKNGITFYDIPWEIVREYGEADVASTEQVALGQLTAFGTTFEELFDEKYFDTYPAFVA